MNRGLTTSSMTNIASTGRSGRSNRQHTQAFVADILRGIHVPIMGSAAVRAGPMSNLQTHLVANVSARGARLAGREPAVRLDKRFPFALALVFDEAGESAPSSVRDSLRQIGVLHHAFHIQILDNDHLVLVHDTSGQLVKVVTSRIGDTLMCASNKAACLSPAIGAFLFARELLLLTFQIAFRLAQMAGIGKLGAVTGHGQLKQANVDPNSLAFGADRRHWHLIVGQDGRMKLTASVPADRHRLDLANDLAVNDAPHPANLRQVHPVAIQLDPLRVLDRLPTMLRLKPGILGTPFKEVLERSRQIAQRLLKNLAISIAKPREFLLQLWKPVLQIVTAKTLPRFAIRSLDKIQGVVPHPPRAAKLHREISPLRGVRIKPYAGGIEHALHITEFRVSVKRCFALCLRIEGRALTALSW